MSAGSARSAGPFALDPLTFVEEAVAIPSPSGSEAALAAHLAERCRTWADASGVDAAGNLVVEVGRGPLRLLILGHLDTVPGEIPIRREGGALYGRGSVDAKGPLCCALLAALRSGDAVRSALSIRVVGAVEEEIESSRGARHLVASSPQPDLLIVAEPSGWDAVALGYKGRLRLRIEVERDHGHSAEAAATASERLLDAVQAVRALVADANSGVEGAFDRLQLSVDALTGGNDGVRQRAHADLGFRLPTRIAPAALERRFAAMALPEGARLTTSGAETAVRAERDTALARAFRTAIRAAGGRPRTKVKTGTSDMNVVAPHWPVPMVAYGPGDAALDHTPHEHLEERDLLRALAVLSAVFERLAADQSPESS